MPLVHVAFLRDRGESDTRAVTDGIYAALRATFVVPEDDRFTLVERFRPGDFLYGAGDLGMSRSDDLQIVQIFCNDTRTVEQKKALDAVTAANLAENPGVRPDDVFIDLVEVKKENWSFGHGIARYA